MNRSDSIATIAPALVAALSKIEGAAKKATNGGFKTKYATLETVIDASKGILAENGITLIQLPGACVDGVMNLETILLHTSGEYISGEMGIALGKTDPQGVGSALTYARRYAQMAALNMPAVDDDGEAAHGRGANQNTQTPAKPTGNPRVVTAMKAAIDMCDSEPALDAWKDDNKVSFDRLSEDDYREVVAYWREAVRKARAARQSAAA